MTNKQKQLILISIVLTLVLFVSNAILGHVIEDSWVVGIKIAFYAFLSALILLIFLGGLFLAAEKIFPNQEETGSGQGR